jgi:hypothetical protein
MPQYLAEYMPEDLLEYLAEYMPGHWIVTAALLGVLLLGALSWSVSRSRLLRLREAAMYVIGETDRRVGLWLQLHPEEAAEPGSLSRQGPLGTSDLVGIVEASGSKELNSRLVTVTQVIVSVAILGAVLYMILSKQYAANDAKWACGIVGTVIGYWLKGK